MAADDTQLNEYVGLKRYATFRDKEKKKRDKKKYSKKRNLREWRKAVFGNENGPVSPTVDAKLVEPILEVSTKEAHSRVGEEKQRKNANSFL